MEDLILFIFVFLLTFFALNLIFGGSGDWDDWVAKCSTDKGQVVLVSQGSWSDHYECYKDGKIINHREN